jgi:hypothetical protein
MSPNGNSTEYSRWPRTPKYNIEPDTMSESDCIDLRKDGGCDDYDIYQYGDNGGHTQKHTNIHTHARAHTHTHTHKHTNTHTHSWSLAVFILAHPALGSGSGFYFPADQDRRRYGCGNWSSWLYACRNGSSCICDIRYGPDRRRVRWTRISTRTGKGSSCTYYIRNGPK